ncbi:MAG: IS1595 family transposase [Gemmatimonadales bacterium]
MLKFPHTPVTLADAITYFADQDNALRFLAELRWPDGVKCPHCGADDPGFLASRRIWKCRAKECRKQFSIKVGTIFEDSPLGLDKWLPALWLLANSKNGISSYELARALDVTQKTAWFMLGRIRAAMATRTFARFEGEIEMDEAFFGGLYKNMHQSKRKRLGSGQGQRNKIGVLGVLQRPKTRSHVSQFQGSVIGPDREMKHLGLRVRSLVQEGSRLYTDEDKHYQLLQQRYIREIINHAREYVRGKVHTNGVENFWSLLKRTIKGTYVSVDPFHFFRYLDEQVFRFNNRRASDGDRFVAMVDSLLGTRLTWKGLTGKDMSPATT